MAARDRLRRRGVGEEAGATEHEESHAPNLVATRGRGKPVRSRHTLLGVKRLVVRLLAGLVVLAASLVSAPADSASFPWRAVITFDKSWASPSNSRVGWELSQLQQDGTWQVVQSRSWRAGSGMLGRAGRNSCARNRGWLPNGSYRVRQYDDYPGHVIKGRAFRLDDKLCPDGTRRFDLFLHTEQGAGNRQCPDRRGDQPCRWEVPRFNDYKSLGCIKMSPADLAELVALYRQHFAAGVRYPADSVVLRVVS